MWKSLAYFVFASSRPWWCSTKVLFQPIGIRLGIHFFSNSRTWYHLTGWFDIRADDKLGKALADMLNGGIGHTKVNRCKAFRPTCVR